LFLQAEDGIRDWSVTGVQTCALPISELVTVEQLFARRGITSGPLVISGSPNPYTPPGPNETLTPAAIEGLWLWGPGPAKQHFDRSEERRVGKEGRSRGVARRAETDSG